MEFLAGISWVPPVTRVVLLGNVKGFLGNPASSVYLSKIEWDLTNGPLRNLLELLHTQVEGSVHWVLLETSWSLTCI